MAGKFKNKYKINSIRLAGWDYSQNGAYFITICTYQKQRFFGEVKSGHMELSGMGQNAHRYWTEIPNRFPYTTLGEYIIMPDHMHGVLHINHPLGGDATPPGGLGGDATPPGGDAINRVATGVGGITGNHNPMLHSNVSKIIRWYKGRTTFENRKIDPAFTWQTRFYDRIVWDENALIRISTYIKNNPAKWVGG